MTEAKKFKVKILRDICISAGSCEVLSPKVFKLDEEAKVTVLPQGSEPDSDGWIEVTQDSLDNVMEAARSCPVFAILVQDENGNQIYP